MAAPRSMYDLHHPIAVTGMVGRIQTLSRIYVNAGDSMSISFQGRLRLSPLRRWVSLDPQVDIAAFFVPHRHVYGQTWIDFINDGAATDASRTLTTVDLGSNIHDYLGTHVTGTVPLHVVAGMNQIYNRYWRQPSDSASIRAANAIPGSNDDTTRAYGLPAARLPTVVSTPLYTAPDIGDRQVATTTDSNSNVVVDLTDFAKKQATYSGEQARDWFAVRYNDVLGMIWGGSANPDADERPTLLARQSMTIGGYDVAGTSDSNLGSFIGRSIADISFQMSQKFFPEHGSLWILACLRFPDLWEKEHMYLDKVSAPTYEQIAGDHDIVGAHPPRKQLQSDYFLGGSSSTEMGYEPYGMWYRVGTPRIHADFFGSTGSGDDAKNYGFPFRIGTIPTKAQAHYCQDSDLSDVFQSTILSQYQILGGMGCMVLRTIPPPVGSIFVGGS